MTRSSTLIVLMLPVMAMAQVPASTPPAKGGAKEKVICKRFEEVGSLIASKKECKPKSEWDAEASDAQKRLSDCTTGAGATGARC